MGDPRHTYRYPEERYRRAMARAASEGTTVSEVITERLDEYVDEWIGTLGDDPEANREAWAAHLRGDPETLNPVAREVLEPGWFQQALKDIYAKGWPPRHPEVIISPAMAAELERRGQTPQQAVEEYLRGLSEPACRAVVRDGPCDCLGFRPQKNSPLRCEDCGHVRGVHQ